MIKSELKVINNKSDNIEKTLRTGSHYEYVEKASEEWPSWKKEIYEKNYIKSYQCIEELKV